MRKVYVPKQNIFVLNAFVFLLTLVLINENFSLTSYASMINSIQSQGPGEAVVPNIPEVNIDDPFHILDNHDFDNTNLIQKRQGEDEEGSGQGQERPRMSAPRNLFPYYSIKDGATFK